MDRDDRDKRLDPEPNWLTVESLSKETEAIRREVSLQREVLENRIQAIQHSGEVTYQLARELLETQLGEHKVNAYERFEGIKEQTALALTTQKEALDKQEAGFTKQIDAIDLRIDTIFQSLNEKIHTLEKRIDRDEGKEKGFTQSTAYVVTAVSILISVISIVIAFNVAVP